MKKLLLMFLTLTMALSANSISFAAQEDSAKEFIEAKTVSVRGESSIVSGDSLKAPKEPDLQDHRINQALKRMIY